MESGALFAFCPVTYKQSNTFAQSTYRYCVIQQKRFSDLMGLNHASHRKSGSITLERTGK